MSAECSAGGWGAVSIPPPRAHGRRPSSVTQVRLAVEKALGLKENSLHKESRAQIKHAVHSVMVRDG